MIAIWSMLIVTSGRVLSPFSGLSKERAYKACECIKESFGTAAKPSLLPSPTGKGFGPNHKCYASDIEVLSKEFTSPTPFCDFYSAWSA
ncbi:hypothetical protein K461DRAFT_283194 [Myriangium duriaei CBS 260.36]|uniref:Uncharacterized protein n=1 Tax=Myriangium duriaei CBS 260.36 TaxID=1168546 RepID=A0A9P4IUK8_9PEZI|nr:hypothetical protein K461DRAFT_283194 [Myriangium duriaei CBS 260.36]